MYQGSQVLGFSEAALSHAVRQASWRQSPGRRETSLPHGWQEVGNDRQEVAGDDSLGDS